MAQETNSFAKQHNLDGILQSLIRKAFQANSKYPLHFVADEIYKMSQSDHANKELLELRKKVSTFQALWEHMKSRNSPAKVSSSDDDEKKYQEYCLKHELRRHRTELVAISYMAEAENPLLFIANYIVRQPDRKIIERKETEDLEKRAEIYKNLIQKLINDNPMNLKEIEDFSTETIKKEMLSKALQ